MNKEQVLTPDGETEIELPAGYSLVHSLEHPAPQVLTPDGRTVSVDQALGEIEDEHAGVRELVALASAGTRQVTSWMDGEPEELQAAIDRRQENRQKLLDWIKGQLKDGTDFGRIHFVKKEVCPDGARCTNKAHFSKPSLWKAGAEKIAGMLGFRAMWPELQAELGHIRADVKVICLRCQLLDQAGRIVSEGVGSRALDQDYGDVNKALKMAKKSGLIDAVLNAGGLSEVFTQDMSDEDSPEPYMTTTLNEDGQAYLYRHALDLFGDKANAVLEALARIRFHLADGKWREIPAYRLQDAIRSLQEKAEDAEEEK